MARTAGNPPPDSRTRRAMARATATSGVSSSTLKAIRKNRAPITVTPAVGCTRAGPKSGAQAGSAIFSPKPSKPPRRTSASRVRSGRRAARS